MVWISCSVDRTGYNVNCSFEISPYCIYRELKYGLKQIYDLQDSWDLSIRIYAKIDSL